jgi:hypothetical protein
MDFNLAAGAFESTMANVDAAIREGWRVGLFHWRRYDLDVSAPLNAGIRQLAQDRSVRIVAPGERVSTRYVVIGYPSILQHPIDLCPKVEFENLFVMVNQLSSVFSDGGSVEYDPLTVRANLKELFGTEGHWVPISPVVRRLMRADRRFPDAYDEDWFPMIDIGGHGVEPLRWRGRERANPVVGRHARDNKSKWPADRATLLAAYCAEKQCVVDILGGADKAIQIVGELPRNWIVRPFGSMPPGEFLSAVDFFIHYPHELYIEAFGRSVLEAMVAGKPVVLPPVFEETFGPAALYAQPADVWRTVSDLWRDEKRYLAQAAVAREFAARECSFSLFKKRFSVIPVRQTIAETRVG